MCKCGKNCSGGCKKSTSGKDMATLMNEVAEMRSDLAELQANTKFLECGHPMMYITHPDDIASFDTETGLGEACWEGWALCNGAVQKLANGKNFTTPNLFDKFIVGAGDSYANGAVGGEAEHTLTVPELPVHNHVITDNGHTHDIQDPGHIHGTVQDPHNHGASAGAHTHSFETQNSGGHNHSVQVGNQGTGQRSGGSTDTATSGENTYVTSTDGVHFHTGTTDNAAGSVTVDDASISIAVSSAFTGIEETESADTDISLADTGAGEPHNNLPPYYAAFIVIKL